MRKILPAVFAVLLVCSGSAFAALWQWSKTSSANGQADPSINWQAGMSPSSVDPSARSMMARIAENRDDTSGLLVQGGTATAYTIASYQGLAAAPNDGQLLGFTVINTNGVGVTLTVDGGTTYPIQSAAGTAVSSGTLIAGSPYTVKFSSGASAWVLRDFYGQPFTIPIGAMLPYTGTTAPNSNFVLPYGQCISRTTYAAYFAQVSTTFGVCNGTTTFGVPDMRGRTIAALDNLGGSAAGNLTTTYFGTDPTVLGNVGGSQNHTLLSSEIPASGYTFTGSTSTLGQSVLGGASTRNAQINDPSGLVTSLTGAISATVIPLGAVTVSGGGNAHAIVQPTMVISFILRIL